MSIHFAYFFVLTDTKKHDILLSGVIELISKRIRKVRESQIINNKKMTQELFGKKLGVTRSVIANIEYNRVEPTEAIIKLICATFNVSYLWLKTGQGEMFEPLDQNTTALFDRIMAGENETAKAIFRAFAELDDEEWKVVEKIIKKIKSV